MFCSSVGAGWLPWPSCRFSFRALPPKYSYAVHLFVFLGMLGSMFVFHVIVACQTFAYLKQMKGLPKTVCSVWFLLSVLTLSLCHASSIAFPSADCVYRVNKTTYDLSSFRNVDLAGPRVQDGHLTNSVIAASVCGNLTFPCIDSLTGFQIFGGAFDFFFGPHNRTPSLDMAAGGGKGRGGGLPLSARNWSLWECWDTIAQGPPVASSLTSAGRGLVLTFTRPGDAHLDCKVMTTSLNLKCQPGMPADAAQSKLKGWQGAGSGCTWQIDVETGDKSVCGG